MDHLCSLCSKQVAHWGSRSPWNYTVAAPLKLNKETCGCKWRCEPPHGSILWTRPFSDLSPEQLTPWFPHDLPAKDRLCTLCLSSSLTVAWWLVATLQSNAMSGHNKLWDAYKPAHRAGLFTPCQLWVQPLASVSEVFHCIYVFKLDSPLFAAVTHCGHCCDLKHGMNLDSRQSRYITATSHMTHFSICPSSRKEKEKKTVFPWNEMRSCAVRDHLHSVLMDLTGLCRCCQGRVKVSCICFGFWEALCVCVCLLGSRITTKNVFAEPSWHFFLLFLFLWPQLSGFQK